MLDGFVQSPVMYFRVLFLIVLADLAAADFSSGNNSFVFNGFLGANLSLNGIAEITSSGLLRVTNNTKEALGHAFYPLPLTFRSSGDGKKLPSFSTTFVFAIAPEYPDMNGHGLAFALSPSKKIPGAMPQQNLGLFNTSDYGNSSNHIIAVELDTVKDQVFDDINDNHVGIDVNSLRSVNSSPVTYFDSSSRTFKSLKLISGEVMQLWVDYHGSNMRLDVAVAPLHVPKPQVPLVSAEVDIGRIMLDEMYVGFSASTGAATESHYILGWSFSLNSGDVPPLDPSKLPHIPRHRSGRDPQKTQLLLSVLVSSTAMIAFLICAYLTVLVIRRRKKFAEVIEDWEMDFGPHRYSYKDLYKATKGFKEEHLLGVGGFGRVYKGCLPKSNTEIAVKKISHESRQGVKEFVSEIASMGRLRHRNLVQLLGYCRRQGELLLVYDYMPNGSLDKYLFDRTRPSLSWSRRFRIIKGVAAGLLYLHEGWEQVVIHRDIKASNVLLDGDFNGKLGDFGLARLYDHGTDPHTTHIVGTLGYLSPELTKTGKASTYSDVYAFGAFLLEVACGRRPMELHASADTPSLLDSVLESWKKGMILDASDPTLEHNYVSKEMELVLKLGLLCYHPDYVARPSMRQVVQFLEGDASLPVMSPDALIYSLSRRQYEDSFDDFLVSVSVPSTSSSTFLAHSSPFLSGNH